MRKLSPLQDIFAFLPFGERIGTAGQPTAEQFQLVRSEGYDAVINLALATSQGALPDEQARIEVRQGEVHRAECGGLEGFNALVKLSRQGTGIFWLVETEEPCERTVTEPAARLLPELRRCLATTAAARP